MSELNPYNPRPPRADDQGLPSTNPYLTRGADQHIESQSDGVHFLDDGILQAELVGSESDAPVEDAGKRIGVPLIAWIVIVAIVLLIVLRPLLSRDDDAMAEPAGANELELRIMEIQGKYFIGAAELTATNEDQQQKLYEGAIPLDTGSIDNRLRFVVLAGELAGPEKATEQLKKLDSKLATRKTETTKSQDQIRDALGKLYEDYRGGRWNSPSLTDAQRELLELELGWFGSLALAPASGDKTTRQTAMGPARRTVAVVVLAFLAGLGLLVAGFVGFFVFIVMVASGKIRSNLNAGSRHGGVYAETFAIWMLLFMVLMTIQSEFARIQRLPMNVAMGLSMAVFFVSLSALVWPILRSVPLTLIRRDVGLTLGKKNILEPFWGLVCYVSTLPMLLFGFLLMFVLLMFINALTGGTGVGDEFAPTSLPSHPIINWIAKAGWVGRLEIILLACVAAPIVEETMFRGVLYRHLRDSTAGWRIAASVIFSGLLSSFIFAVIHPQGIVAVPALMSLAFGFSLAREWRGSLLAPMTMHAANNFMVTLVMLAIL